MDGNNHTFLEELLGERPESNTPTACGMVVSLDHVAVAVRTTVCDIMCITTTQEEYREGHQSPKKFSKSLNVCLPYRKTSSFEEMFEASTPLQQIKVVEAKNKRNKILTRERDEFMRKTRDDRLTKEYREQLASTKLQALFRGYQKRPKDPTGRRPPRGPNVLPQYELREFLANLAHRLHLKPIKGLTLAGANSKNSKPQVFMRHAGAFVLTRFFMMIQARKRARSYMNRVRLCKAVRVKHIIYRFGHLTLRRMKERLRIKKIRNECAITIQTQIRVFLARRTVRLLKRKRIRYRRELEAATIIQRAFRGRLSLFHFPEFDLLMEELEKAVIEAEINALMLQGGEERQTELDRQAELEMMYLEDIRSLRAGEYAEWLRQQELERLRLLELERLARLAAEAAERRRLLEEQNRLDELRRMRLQDEESRWREAEDRRLAELARMRQEDLEAARMRKYWDDERRRLEEEERLRRLAEEEERRRQAALRAQFAREEAEKYTKKLLEDAVVKRALESGLEAAERRRMEREDEESQRRRAEDERLRLERLRALQEAREREEAERRRVLALMEAEVFAEIEREVVEEELRAMLQTELDELDRQRRAADTGSIIRQFAEQFVADVIQTAIRNLTEDEDERLRRLREEEERRRREMEEDELRRMRLEDEAAQRERQRLRDLEDELRRMQFMEDVEEPIDAVLGELFALIEDANFDEAENQLQEELDRLLSQGDDVDKALLCSVQLLLGHVKLQLAKFSEAHALFTASRDIRLELYSADSIQYAEAGEALASCAQKQARYEDASALFEEALTVTALTMKGILQPVPSDIPTADPMQLHVRLLLEQAEMNIERGMYREAEGQVGQAHEKVLYMQRFASGDYDDDHSSLEVLLTDCEYLRAVMEKLKGHYKVAVEKYRKVHDDRERLLGVTHPKIASILGALAEIELHRCHYPKATEFLDMAQEINNQFFGANHPSTLGYATIRARLLSATGDYQTSLEHVTDVLRRRKAIYMDLPHPTVAECFFIAGECSRGLGNAKMAQKYYEEARAIRSQLFTRPHVSGGESLLGLATNAIARTHYLAAVPLLEEAFAQYQVVATSMDITDFVDLEVCRSELAHGYILVGRYDDAKALLKAVGKLMHQLVGPKHVHLASSLYVLALYKQTLGLHFDANILYNHSEDILNQTVGPGHSHHLRVAFAACANFRGPGYYEDAAVKLNQASTLASDLFEADSVPVARALHQRGVLMMDLGDLTEASRLLPLALKTCKEKLGMKCALFAEILGDIGEALRLEGKYDPAALALTQALQLRRTHFGDSHYMVGEVLVSQGLLLLDQHSPGEALRVLDTAAVPLLSACLGEGHPHTMYAKGCVGLALNTLYAMGQEGRSAPSTPRRKATFAGGAAKRLARSVRFGRGGVFDPRGKELITATLALFDEYPQCPFGDSHPWALELGGWNDKTAEGAEADETLSESGESDGSGASHGRKHAHVKGFAQEPAKVRSLEGALASMDSPPPTAIPGQR